jgi:hypothetical protein
MNKANAFLSIVLSALVTLSAANSSAEDVYYVKPLADLEFVGEKPNVDDHGSWRWGGMSPPQVAIKGEGEAFVVWMDANRRIRAEGLPDLNGTYLAIRLPADRKVEGRLFLPDNDPKKHTTHQFTIPAGEAKADQRKKFLSAQRVRYLTLLSRDIPGAAWFRYQVSSLDKELGIKTTDDNRRRRFFGTSRSNDLEDTFALISGGRAVSENLQLDRVLPEAKVAPETVPLSSLTGITVREFDWTSLVKDVDPKLDPLAKLIPDDQHALFFPSFTAMVSLAENATEQSAPILSFAEPKAESASVRERYERQLCLSLGSAAKLLGPRMIKSVAMTGGDPYLRTGSDVAVIFEAKSDTDALRKMMEAQVSLAASAHPSALPKEGKIGKVTYIGRRSPDREICSYVAAVAGAVVVTNSTAQLERIVKVSEDSESSLAALDEYRFFRDRYPLGDKNESALLIVSDKTIRRWCGPKWRIGTSRRTRAVALMTQMQAEKLDDLVGHKVQKMEVDPPKSLPDAGKFLISTDGVGSSVYGTLDFQTPLIELDFNQVTKEEATFYRRWRDGYQRNWSNFFDPIAVRLFTDKEKISADLTVMPLIDVSDYREFVDIARNAKIKPEASDPHAEAIVQWTLSVSPKALSEKWGGLAEGMIRVNPFSWMGETFSLYVDKDEFWAKLAKAEDKEDFAEEHLHEIPVALNAEVRSGFKLAAFLTAIRAFVEQTAPDMLEWQIKRHNDQAYVRVALSEKGRADSPDELDKLAIYYASSGGSLTVTLSEAMLKRALDRNLARRSDEIDKKPLTKPARPLLGENFCVQADKALLKLIEAGFAPEYQRAMQRRAWSNLPILNEWKRRYPNQDPVALHEEFWQRQLICPGGGKYRWNEEWQTMESTVYGHPGAPKEGPTLPPALSDLAFGNFGITFEENGLRARVALERDGE